MPIERPCSAMSTMHSRNPFKIRPEARHKYAKYGKNGIQDYHHGVICSEYAFFYFWDTRMIDIVLPLSALSQEDLTYDVIDNRMDLAVARNADGTIDDNCSPQECWDAAEQVKELLPVQFRTLPLTQHEYELTLVEHV